MYIKVIWLFTIVPVIFSLYSYIVQIYNSRLFLYYTTDYNNQYGH